MTQAELRKYIVTILLDVRGDNEYPADDVLQANASLLLGKVMFYVGEVIGVETNDVPDSITGNVERRVKEQQIKRAELRQQR